MMKKKLLLVDDEPLILDLLSTELQYKGYEVFCAACGVEALAIAEAQPLDLAILDYSLPDKSGDELFHLLRAIRPELPVMFLTGYPNLESAVNLMKMGANDYLTKPIRPSELTARVRLVLENNASRPVAATGKASKTPSQRQSGGYIFGNSPAMRALETQMQKLPRYPDATVLITGPTGTGKSAIARRIHELTWGGSAPYVEIDCSTIPHELCESELFGHEKGSFTGAHKSKQGLFEAAGCGTAFLDEIGELDINIQTKFLRVLEARQFRRVGHHETLPMTARVIAATNRSLPEMIALGRFREDLFFRLNVFELAMPPLRERTEDIPMLAKHFLDRLARHYKKEISGFTSEAMSFLMSCNYPGNVRELRNIIERAVISSDSHLIDFPNLVFLQRPSCTFSAPCIPDAPEVGMQPQNCLPTSSLPDTSMNLAFIERKKLLEALSSAGGNKSLAAKMVGLSRTAFHRRLQKYQNSVP